MPDDRVPPEDPVPPSRDGDGDAEPAGPAAPEWELRRLFDMLSDAELVDILRAEASTGSRPMWKLVRAVLAHRCVGALHKLILTGRLNERTRKLGRPVNLGHGELDMLRDDRVDRTAIVGDAVTAGLNVFYKHGILGGLWQPGGASLGTYAVNACLREAGQTVRTWRARRRPLEIPLGIGAETGNDPALRDDGPDPADAAVERLGPGDPLEYLPAACREWMAGKPWLREAIRLRIAHGEDLKWADIAVEVGVGPRALEGALRRLRQCMERNKGEGRP